jgi:hypothetical protein
VGVGVALQSEDTPFSSAVRMARPDILLTVIALPKGSSVRILPLVMLPASGGVPGRHSGKDLGLTEASSVSWDLAR